MDTRGSFQRNVRICMWGGGEIRYGFFLSYMDK